MVLVMHVKTAKYSEVVVVVVVVLGSGLVWLGLVVHESVCKIAEFTNM